LFLLQVQREEMIKKKYFCRICGKKIKKTKGLKRDGVLTVNILAGKKKRLICNECLNATEYWRRMNLYSDIFYNPDYSISTWGRVRRETSGQATRKERILKMLYWGDKGKNYYRVCLGKRFLWIHWLVLRYFVGIKQIGFELDHMDGNKLKNKLSNLEYVTRSENQKRAYKLGLNSPPEVFLGEFHHNSKFVNEDIVDIVKMYNSGDYTQREISEFFNVNESTISGILDRNSYLDVETEMVKLRGRKRAIKILKKWKTGKYCKVELSRMFGTDRGMVERLTLGHTWKNLER